MTWYGRLAENLNIAKEESSFAMQPVMEDVYKFTLPESTDEQVLNSIENTRLFSLYFFSQERELDMYKLQPLLKKLIRAFFRVKVYTFTIYGLEGLGTKIIPMLKNGSFIYSSWPKINYFIYYVKVDELKDYQLYSPQFSEEKEIYTLFGVKFIPKVRDWKRVGLFDEKEEQVLPYANLLVEIRESFPSQSLTSGSFWVSLDENWLFSAWNRILSGNLPRVTIFFPSLAEDMDMRLYLLVMLAKEKVGQVNVVESNQNSITVEIGNERKLALLLEEMAGGEKKMLEFVVSGSDTEEQAYLVQQVFELKYPSSFTLRVGKKVVCDLNIEHTPEFSDEELDIDRSYVPKQYRTRREEKIPLPILEEDEQGQALINTEQTFPLGTSYEELYPVWSQAVLSPWAKSRLLEGKWTHYWHK